jgi:hypothetical protein
MWMHRFKGCVIGLAAAAGAVLGATGPAAATGSIHPGVQTATDGAHRTANFVLPTAAPRTGFVLQTEGNGWSRNNVLSITRAFPATRGVAS